MADEKGLSNTIDAPTDDGILNNICRNSLITIGLLIGSLPAQASVPYDFTSKPVYVGAALQSSGTIVQTDPGLLNGVVPVPPIEIGSPVGASLTFASPLAPNSTTPIHAESDGLSLLGPARGGVQGFSATSAYTSPVPITSDISKYVVGLSQNLFFYDHYSTVDGQVTTNAAGDISAWNLNFTLLGGNGILVLNRGNNPPTLFDSFPSFHPQSLLSINSNPAADITFSNVTELNGQTQQPPTVFTVTGPVDTVFANDGRNEFQYNTQQPGIFTIVPEPESWGMMMAGLALLGWRMRSIRS